MEDMEHFSSQIMLSDHKTSTNKFQKTEIIQSMGKKVQRKERLKLLKLEMTEETLLLILQQEKELWEYGKNKNMYVHPTHLIA